MAARGIRSAADRRECLGAAGRAQEHAAAFDRAWRTVEASGVAAGLDGKTAEMREAIALRIVAMADTGITNATELAIDALSYVTAQRFPDTGERLSDND